MKILYRVDEIAEMLSMSRSSVYNLVNEGKLEGHNDAPGKKGMRVTAESIRRYVEKYKIKTTEEFGPAVISIRKILSKGIE